MGRSYWFECVRCGYRAKVSGGSDRGLNVFVQTVVCRECKELFDAVTKLRLPDQARAAVYRRIWQILSGEEEDAKYARLSPADRRAIVEILRETKKGLPEYWQKPAGAP